MWALTRNKKDMYPAPMSPVKFSKDGADDSFYQQSSLEDHSNSDSNSSTEDSHTRRVALMMASPVRPSHPNSSREKQRRRSRTSNRRANGNARSYPSQDILLGNNGLQSPLVDRRKLSASFQRRISSKDSLRLHADSSDDLYSSIDFSSESSLDSSPSRFVSEIYALQHDDSSSQGQQFSRLSQSTRRSISRSSNDSIIGGESSKFNGNVSPTKNYPMTKRTSMKSKATSGNKSCSLAATFMSIIILSISGMILLTRQAAPTSIGQDQYAENHFNLPSDHSVRGKKVLGRMWDTISHSEDLNKRQKSHRTEQKVKKKALTVEINNKLSVRKTAVPSRSQSKVNKKTKKEATPTVSTHRLKIHQPPSVLKLEPNFEKIDRNLYFHSSVSRNSSETYLAPRIVMLDPFVKQVSRKIKKYPADFTDNTQLYGILPSDDERLKKMEIREPYSKNECVPMQDWQTTYQPSCNGMHELALETLGASDGSKIGKVGGLNATLFGSKGFWRYAWKVVLGTEEDTIVFKNLKYEHNFEDAHFEHDRIDAVAMERLTSSPHVINVFGFCGHSVMTEYADGKRLGELADKSKKIPLKRLEIARDIANGLADVHGIDGDGNATFVHLDVNPANVVSVNNTLKLNDFNIGIIRQWNTTSNEACGFPTQYPNPQWRSPEEARNEQHLTEKVDIFSLGHIFFRLICGHEPWNKLEPGGKPTKNEINEKVQRGDLPFIPDHVMNSQDPEIIIIRNVMLQCYSFDPLKRPSARNIANTLDRALHKLEKKHRSSNPPKTAKKISPK